MARRGSRTLTLPIVTGLIAIPLTIAMLVGWIIVVASGGPTWLLVLGTISMSFILFFMVLLSVYLVREIREVRRHVRFIDSVTHELKTPLASLKLLLETQGRPGVSAEQSAEMRRMMAGDIDRLMGFIDDLLRAGGGPAQGPRQVSRFRLWALMDRCTARVARRHEVDAGRIRNEIPRGIELLTDEAVVEAILTNLVDNAVKYSDPPLDVAIKTIADKDNLIIEVSDRGIGLSKRELRKVFKRFYRAPGVRVNSVQGTGLGLFVVKGLVRELGGELEAFSAGPGLGTTMRVTLPRTHLAAPQTNPPRHLEVVS